MTTVAVLQARMGSTRLPGKVLETIAGRPMLQLMLERLGPIEVDELIVATSVGAGDDPIAELTANLGHRCIRGSEPDVLSRYRTAVEETGATTVIRLTADCPLADPAIVQGAIAHHREEDATYTSNTLIRTFPDGLDVEVIEAEALLEADDRAVDPAEREHVTPYIYRRGGQYRLAALCCEAAAGNERWTVDTVDDLARVRAVIDTMGGIDFSWSDALDRVGRSRRPVRGQLWIEPVLAPLTTADGRVIRSWTATIDGDEVGGASVTVDDAAARLDLSGTGTHDGPLVHLILAALRQDQQVVELTPASGRERDALLAAGFPAGRWIRS